MSAPGLRERFESSLRSGKRRIGRGVPASRRVKGLGGAKGRRRLQVRKLVAPFLQRPITLTTPTGLRLRVTGDPVDELIAQHLLGPNRSEYFPAWPGEARSGMCILDVGAHHGLYAAAALHEYPSSRVICVEPSPSSLPPLHANLAVNGYAARARIVNAALAAAPGVGLLRHTDEGSWGNSLFEEEAVATSSEKVVL
ncbi:MAG: hypothetical protein QOI55_3104, partial [Actinomycetota bacterium]|nr:hypothetical protein [Actinomycetota bacterium]